MGRMDSPSLLSSNRKQLASVSASVQELPSKGKGHTFELFRVRQFFHIFQRDIRA
jgi:hypothetical protein